MENNKLCYLVVYLTFDGKKQFARSIIYECENYIDSKEEFKKLEKWLKSYGIDCGGFFDTFNIVDVKLLSRN